MLHPFNQRHLVLQVHRAEGLPLEADGSMPDVIVQLAGGATARPSTSRIRSSNPEWGGSQPHVVIPTTSLTSQHPRIVHLASEPGNGCVETFLVREDDIQVSGMTLQLKVLALRQATGWMSSAPSDVCIAQVDLDIAGEEAGLLAGLQLGKAALLHLPLKVPDAPSKTPPSRGLTGPARNSTTALAATTKPPAKVSWLPRAKQDDWLDEEGARGSPAAKDDTCITCSHGPAGLLVVSCWLQPMWMEDDELSKRLAADMHPACCLPLDCLPPAAVMHTPLATCYCEPCSMVLHIRLIGVWGLTSTSPGPSAGGSKSRRASQLAANQMPGAGAETEAGSNPPGQELGVKLQIRGDALMHGAVQLWSRWQKHRSDSKNGSSPAQDSSETGKAKEAAAGQVPVEGQATQSGTAGSLTPRDSTGATQDAAALTHVPLPRVRVSGGGSISHPVVEGQECGSQGSVSDPDEGTPASLVDLPDGSSSPGGMPGAREDLSASRHLLLPDTGDGTPTHVSHVLNALEDAGFATTAADTPLDASYCWLKVKYDGQEHISRMVCIAPSCPISSRDSGNTPRAADGHAKPTAQGSTLPAPYAAHAIAAAEKQFGRAQMSAAWSADEPPVLLAARRPLLSATHTPGATQQQQQQQAVTGPPQIELELWASKDSKSRGRSVAAIKCNPVRLLEAAGVTAGGGRASAGSEHRSPGLGSALLEQVSRATGLGVVPDHMDPAAWPQGDVLVQGKLENGAAVAVGMFIQLADTDGRARTLGVPLVDASASKRGETELAARDAGVRGSVELPRVQRHTLDAPQRVLHPSASTISVSQSQAGVSRQMTRGVGLQLRLGSTLTPTATESGEFCGPGAREEDSSLADGDSTTSASVRGSFSFPAETAPEEAASLLDLPIPMPAPVRQGSASPERIGHRHATPPMSRFAQTESIDSVSLASVGQGTDAASTPPASEAAGASGVRQVEEGQAGAELLHQTAALERIGSSMVVWCDQPPVAATRLPDIITLNNHKRRARSLARGTFLSRSFLQGADDCAETALSRGTPEPGAVVLGYIDCLIDNVTLPPPPLTGSGNDAPAGRPGDYYLTIQCGTYWVVTRPRSITPGTRPGVWSLAIRIPLTHPSLVLSIALFRAPETGAARKIASVRTVIGINLSGGGDTLVGRLRLRPSQLRPGCLHSATLPMLGERGQSKGPAVTANCTLSAMVRWLAMPPMLTSYLMPPLYGPLQLLQQGCLAGDDVHSPFLGHPELAVSNELVERRRRRAVLGWLSSSSCVSVPLNHRVARRALEDGRQDASLSRTAANWKRLQAVMASGAPLAAWWQRVQSWQQPWYSALVAVCIMLAAVWPSRAAAIGAVAAAGALLKRKHALGDACGALPTMVEDNALDGPLLSTPVNFTATSSTLPGGALVPGPGMSHAPSASPLVPNAAGTSLHLSPSYFDTLPSTSAPPPGSHRGMHHTVSELSVGWADAEPVSPHTVSIPRPVPARPNASQPNLSSLPPSALDAGFWGGPSNSPPGPGMQGPWSQQAGGDAGLGGRAESPMRSGLMAAGVGSAASAPEVPTTTAVPLDPLGTLRAHYDSMVRFMLTVQNVLDGLAASAERVQALCSWSDPLATAMLLFSLLGTAVALWCCGIPVLIAFMLLFDMRPPALRDPWPAPPANLLGYLPTRSDHMG